MEKVIMTEPKRHEQVNEFTEEERQHIHNELSKVVEPEDYAPSPVQSRQASASAFAAIRKVASCQHEKPRYVGAATWCGACGAIKLPLPTPKNGIPIADGQWEIPALFRQM